MAAPTFVAAGTNDAGTTAITPGIPAGVANGDLLLLVCESAAGDAVSAPAGWATAPNSPQDQPNGTPTRLSVFWRIRDGSEGSTVSVADSGNHTIGRIVAFRGVDQTNPFNTTVGDIKGPTSPVSMLGVTTTRDNCRIVFCLCDGFDATTTAFNDDLTNANLTGLSRHTVNSTTSGNGGGIATGSGVMASAGATGATTITHVNAVQAAYVVLAVQPPLAAITGTGAATTAAMQASGSGAASVSGSGSVQTLAMQASGSGATANEGDGTPALAPMQASGSGTVANDGDGAATTLPMQASGSGTVEDAGTPATIAITNLASAGTSANAASYDTASVSPAADRLLILALGADSGSTLTAPTVSGLGLTWVQIDASEPWLDTSNNYSGWVYAAFTGGSAPTPGVVTADFGAQAPGGFEYSLDSVEGADMTGTVADAFVQHTRNSPGTSATSGSATLSSFADSTHNAAYGVGHHPINEATSAGTGFTLLGEGHHSSPAAGLATEWKLGEDTGVDFSWVNSSAWSVFAAEIQAGVVTVTDITGTGAATLAPGAADGDGTVIISGTGAAATLALLADGDGAAQNTGTGAPALAPLAASGSGSVQTHGTGTPALAALSADGDGVLPIVGTGTPSVTPSVDGVGVVPNDGTGASTAPPFSADGTSSAGSTGTGAATTLPFSADGDAIAPISGSGTPALAAPSADGDGATANTGDGTPSLAALSAAGSGAVSVQGSGSSTLEPSADGTGAVSISGSGSAALAPFEAQGFEADTTVGTGSASPAAFNASGSGQVAVSGSGTPGLEPLNADGDGAVPNDGTGAATLPPFSASGSSSAATHGSGDANLDPFNADGGAGAIVSGTGSAALVALSADGDAVVDLTGDGAAELPTPSADGTGVLPIVGSGTPSISPSADGDGDILVVGAGAAALPAFRATGTNEPAIAHLWAYPVEPLWVAALDDHWGIEPAETLWRIDT